MLSAMHTSKLTAAVYYSAFSRRIILRGDIKLLSSSQRYCDSATFQNDADQTSRNRELTKSRTKEKINEKMVSGNCSNYSSKGAFVWDIPE